MNVIKRWMFKEARWWQFWLPQSGIAGGSLAMLLVVMILLLVVATGWYDAFRAGLVIGFVVIAALFVISWED